MLSFLSLITFGSDCYNDFSNRYRICIDDDGKVIVNQQTGKDFYSLKNGRWIVCREKSDCTQLKSEQKKLYFETSVAIHLSGKVSRIVGEDNNPKELCPIELKGSIGVEKGSGETALLNLHQVLQSRVNAVRNEREYHLNHYRNLEKIISDYNKSFSIISEEISGKSEPIKIILS